MASRSTAQVPARRSTPERPRLATSARFHIAPVSIPTVDAQAKAKNWIGRRTESAPRLHPPLSFR